VNEEKADRPIALAARCASATESLHVALFCPDMSVGGAEKMFRRLAVAFAQAGMRVDLVLAITGGPNAQGLPPAVRLVYLHSRRLLSSVGPLVRYLNQARPDILVSTLTHANIPAIWARALAKHKPQLIVREANTLSVDSSRSALVFRNHSIPVLARLFYPCADTVVAVSKGVARDLVDNVGIPRSVVRVVYNPTFDSEILSLMDEPVNHPWFGDEGPPVLLSAGRLTLQKRFDILIQAVSIARRHRPLRAVILGEGEERNRLESLVRELGLCECISLPGLDENPYAYMARARLYVMSSDWEGFPNALVEAMACGLPVVATDCPSGPREILETESLGPGPYGTLVPVDNPEKLAEAILLELNLNHDRSGLQRRAQRFSSTRAVRSYMDLMCRRPDH